MTEGRGDCRGPLIQESCFPLPEGPVVFIAPSALSEASANDLADWLALHVRRYRRHPLADRPMCDGDLYDTRAALAEEG